MRSGLVAKKLGMSQMYDQEGRHIPVTVLALDACRVLERRTLEKDGYTALQIGAGIAKPKRRAKPQKKIWDEKGLKPPKIAVEFRVDEEALLDVGAELSSAHFVEGQYVDAVGQSIGKGFAGVMKRHNFSGLRASHGVSINHRSQGSTGQCQDPGRVFKGKKMAGHMGAERVTVQNLKVFSIDAEKGLLLVKGAVPGAKGSWVFLRDAVKKPLPDNAPLPAALVGQEAAPTAQEPEEPLKDNPAQAAQGEGEKKIEAAEEAEEKEKPEAAEKPEEKEKEKDKGEGA